MYSFFYQLFYSMFRGQWVTLQSDSIYSKSGNVMEHLLNWLMQTLGGNYADMQPFNFYTTTGQWSTEVVFVDYLCTIFAVITIFGLVFAVWKLIKSIFNIFFAGWR